VSERININNLVTQRKKVKAKPSSPDPLAPQTESHFANRASQIIIIKIKIIIIIKQRTQHCEARKGRAVSRQIVLLLMTIQKQFRQDNRTKRPERQKINIKRIPTGA